MNRSTVREPSTAADGRTPVRPPERAADAMGGARLALAALFLAGAAAVAVPAPADTLVSNLGKSHDGQALVDNSTPFVAQAFTTGSPPNRFTTRGYTLESVTLDIRTAPGSSGDITVTIREDSSGGPGSAVVATLTNPSNVTTSGNRTFDAPSDTLLAPRTTYWVHARRNSGSFRIGFTNDNGEDSDRASGSFIADTYKRGSDVEDPSLRIRVDGATITRRFKPNRIVTDVPEWTSGANFFRRVDVTEQGRANRYRVKMRYAVEEDVTVLLEALDPDAVSFSPKRLTFTPSNWNDYQTVRVTGLDDADGLDEWTYVAQQGGGASPEWVRVYVRDNDAHAQNGHSLVYNDPCHCLRVAQGGAGQTFTVKLGFEPEGTTTLYWDPLVYGPVRAADNGNAIKVFKIPSERPLGPPPDNGIKISPKYMTFTRDNWNVPQAFTVTADAHTAGTVIPLRPMWEQSQYPYTKRPIFSIEVVTSIATALPDPPSLNAIPGDGAVRLTWTPRENGGGITGWQARYGEVDPRNAAVDWGRWYTIPGAERDAASHIVTRLANGTGYGFQVRAAVGDLETSPSIMHIAMPMAGRTLDAPGRPELDAYSGNGAVDLSWETPRFAGTITGWQYRYGLLDGPTNTVDWGGWTDIGDATARTRSHTVTGLVNDTEYGFQLRAVAGDKAGDMSERKIAWPYHPPFDEVEFTEVTSTAIAIGWVLPRGVEATGLRAMQRPVGGEWEEAAELALDATSYTFTGLTPATRYNFRIVLDSATGGTATGTLIQDTLAAAPLDTRMAGSVPEPDDGTLLAETPARGCRVDVGVRFLNADGNAVAVESLSASDFAVENGRAGAPVADADGLAWTVPVRATAGFTGPMRVRLTETGRWAAAEQAFRVAGDTDCAPVARSALASLALDGLDLDPAFAAATTAYAAAAPADRETATVAAEAVYGASGVVIAPADADEDADGHQVALAEGETEIAVTVTPADGTAAKTWTVTVTREAAMADSGVLTGFVLVDASNDADLGTVENGGTVSVSANGSYGIRAGIEGNATVGSVVLTLAGPGAEDTHTQTENIAPYSLYGDAQGAEHGRALAAGSYTLTATAYAQSRGGGDVLGTLTAAFTVAVEAAPPPSAGVLTGFTLLDASDQTTVATLTDDADIDLGDGSGGSFAIRADVAPDATVGSVTLSLSGAKTVSATENIAPYSLYGDDMQGTLHGGSLPAGAYTLSATAYAARRASGAVLGTLSLSFEVLAPAALSVADARAEEGTDATLDFAVTLDREAANTVTVAYATADGTAVAGSDYTATSGTLTFQPGERERTVSVLVLEDDHDEGSETLTLRLSNAQGAAIADGEATGTITNDGPIPQAWLARFGRTVTGQVLDAVEARLAAPRTPGAEASLAGRALPSWRSEGAAGAGAEAAAAERREEEARAGLAAMTAWLAQMDADGAGPEPESRALTQRDFLTGTSFALTGGGRDGGFASLWGGGSISGFDGREGSLTVDGEVTTGLIGADWAAAPGSGSGAGNWIAGLAVGHSSGTGGWRRGGACGDNCGGGKIEAVLTGLYPYAGIDVTERLSLWAAAGWGWGEVTVTPDGESGLTADLSMSMGATGLRSEVVRPEDGDGLALAVKSDARLARTSSDAVRSDTGNLEAADAEVWLLRTGIEGSRPVPLGEDGASVTPSFELGARLDGGDAETGMGADLGGGLAFADPKNGVALDMKARGLMAHESPGFREWGASLSASWDPRPATDRGLSLSLRQSWGASPSGGMDALLSRETLAGLAPEDGEAGFEASSRLEGELGYGLAMFGGAFTGTPNVGFALSSGGARDWRIGWRLTAARPDDPGFEIVLDATRGEPANDNAPPEHGVTLKAAIRW